MANKDTNINFRIDAELKKQAEEFFDELGMSMSTAFNLFLKQSLRQQKIPFEISLNTPNAETIAAFKEGDNLLKDPNARRFSTVEELFKELND